MANILLIEPDRVLADTYGQALTVAGHHVVAAATAQAAIQAADAMEPSLVILELQLVEHSGIEFLYEFRSYLDWQFNNSRELLKDELGVQLYLYKLHTSLRELLAHVRQAVPSLA